MSGHWSNPLRVKSLRNNWLLWLEILVSTKKIIKQWLRQKSHDTAPERANGYFRCQQDKKNLLSLIKRTFYKRVFLFLVLTIIPFFMWLPVLLLHNNKLLSTTVATKTIVKWCIPQMLRYVLLCKLLNYILHPKHVCGARKVYCSLSD